jgi:hypothetical protein
VVEANLADTGLSLGNWATVAAGIAAHSIAIQLFPKSGVAFADALVSSQDVTQSRHTHILRLWDWVCRFDWRLDWRLLAVGWVADRPAENTD